MSKEKKVTPNPNPEQGVQVVSPDISTQPAQPAQSRKGRWTRRRFLRWGLGTAAGAGLVGVRIGCYEEKRSFQDLKQLSPTAGAILYAVVDATLPPQANRSPARLRQHVRDADAYLAGLASSDLLQLHLLLYGIEHGTLLAGYVRRFTRLSLADRQRILYDWQTSQIGMRRLGFQSLKTLVFMAYYRTAEAFRTIGYSGPIAPGYQGPPESRKRYDSLLAPPGQSPQFTK